MYKSKKNLQQTYSFEFQIHKSREVLDIKKKVLIWLKREFSFDGTVADLTLYSMNAKKVGVSSLKVSGIQEDCTLEVTVRDEAAPAAD